MDSGIVSSEETGVINFIVGGSWRKKNRIIRVESKEVS